MKLTQLTVPEQDALIEWSNNAEGDLRRLLQDRPGLWNLKLPLEETDPAKSLTAFLQEMVPVWLERRRNEGRIPA